METDLKKLVGQRLQLLRLERNLTQEQMSEKLNLIPEEAGEKVSAIYRQFRKRQHEIRMQGADQAKVEPDEVTDQVNEVKKLWNLVLLHPSNEAD